MDFPDSWIAPVNISTISRFCGEPGNFAAGLSNTISTTIAVASNSQTFYYPLNLPGVFHMTTFFWLNGSGGINGNVSMCIRTVPHLSTSTILAQSSPIAQSGTLAIQVAAATAGSTIGIPAGSYLLGISISNNGGTFTGRTVATQLAARLGFLQSSAALGTPDGNAGVNGQIFCGISRWNTTSSRQIW